MKPPLQPRNALLAGETQALHLLVPGGTQNVFELDAGTTHGILI